MQASSIIPLLPNKQIVRETFQDLASVMKNNGTLINATIHNNLADFTSSSSSGINYTTKILSNILSIRVVFSMIKTLPSGNSGLVGGTGGVATLYLHNASSVITMLAQLPNAILYLNGSSPQQYFNWTGLNGCPVMIKYPFLGYGDVYFYVQNPVSGQWVLIHTIQYANSSTAIELSNPSLQFLAFASASATVTNVICYVGSYSLFLSGERNFLSNPKWGMDSYKASITTETCLLNIQNCTSYNGVANRGMIRIHSISFGNINSSVAILRLKLNGTIGGSPSYTPISGSTANNGATITSGNSIASYDIAGTTISGGIYLWGISAAGNSASNLVYDLSGISLLLAPGDVLSVTGFASSSSTLVVTVGCSDDI